MSAGCPLLSDLAQGEYVSAFRQAPRRENALPITNAGMRVLFEEGTDLIKDLSIFYGGAVSTTVCAKQTCRTLIGRYNFFACSLSLNKGTLRTWVYFLGAWKNRKISLAWLMPRMFKWIIWSSLNDDFSGLLHFGVCTWVQLWCEVCREIWDMSCEIGGWGIQSQLCT